MGISKGCRLLALAWLTAALTPLHAAELPSLSELPVPTLGGKQFWADELFFHGWRIQRNVLTGHCRLLDKGNRRYFFGTFDQCRQKLEQIRRQQALPPMRGKAVLVLHGLFRTRASMDKLCQYLRRHGGYTVFNVGYPSTQREVGSHARALARIIENLDGIEEINFVAHSMGNIVVRHYLADRNHKRPTSETPPARIVRRADPRLKRFVMLGPPNHGSLAAVALAENGIFKVLTGQSGQQLGAKWAELEGKLATPDFEFGIIAGGRGNQTGYNPLLPGDDDGTVSLAGTRLAGARDFAVLPVLHTSMIHNEKVLEHTLRFLQKGFFVSADGRQPVMGSDE